MKLPRLNGWLRMYVVAAVLWIAFTTYSLVVLLPAKPDLSMVESRAFFSATAEVEDARRKPSGEARYMASDPICEAAYLGAGVNKNECMEFMVGTTTLSPSSVALMELRIASAVKSGRVQRMRQEADEQFNAAFAELLPDYLLRILAVPLVVFVLGHTVAWVRRGFQLGK